MPENNKPKTYTVIPSGPLLDFDMSMVDEAWTGPTGAGKMEPGVYEWVITQMIRNAKPAYHAAVYKYLAGPADEQHEDWKTRTQMMFFHFDKPEKKAANYYYGFLKQVCPWALWPGFTSPPDPRTGKSHIWPDWFTGGTDGIGARVRCAIVEAEINGKPQIQMQQGTIEMLEPSSFAKGMLAVAGIQDWHTVDQPATMPQVGQLFGNQQQTELAVKQGLAALGQMPMVNLGGITAPQFQAQQRQKPIA